MDGSEHGTFYENWSTREDEQMHKTSPKLFKDVAVICAMIEDWGDLHICVKMQKLQLQRSQNVCKINKWIRDLLKHKEICNYKQRSTTECVDFPLFKDL